MHNVFVSYHHYNDQWYKNTLIEFGKHFGVFIDKSVDTGAIPEHLSDQAIREKIRDEHLRDSTVTILLAGVEAKGRKHIDWELYSSMFDGTRNKKSGILVVNLPSVQCPYYVAEFGEEEKRLIYPDNNSWSSIESRAEQQNRFPHLPERIIDNLIAPKARISIVPWDRLNSETLKFLVDATFDARNRCEYDLARPMRRRNA
ncbi:MAG: TIR domain-containing protein [Alphaproteobacteria bacterium]|nr:TIR domain-containing protein [Alphaproteobacteria bacterium]